MTDYGHELAFGTFITPDAANADRVVELAMLTEAAGLDLATFQDHPYNKRFLDAWALIATVLSRTSTLRLTTNVSNLPLRPAYVLVVDEELDRVRQRVDARSPQRQGGNTKVTDECCERTGGHSCGGTVGQPGERRHQDPARGPRLALADQQMHHQIPYGPLAAQRRGIGTDDQSKIAERLALTAGEGTRGSSHDDRH